MLEGLKKIPHLQIKGKKKEECEVCIEGKMTKMGFPKASKRKSEHPLDLIHSDLMGKLPVSLGGSIYMVTFVDDYSRFFDGAIFEAEERCFERFSRV